MKSVFTGLIFAFVLMVSSPALIHAADGLASGSINNSGSIDTEETPLMLSKIQTQDDAHIIVEFNQSIVSEAVRVRITKQSSNSTLKTEHITSIVDNSGSVLVSLTDLLEEGATYTLTILSAISEGGIVIKEGADATKEFTTPVPLKKSVIVFNAPSNPNAVIATSGSITTTPTSVNTNSGNQVIKTAEITTNELPLTGMNPMLLVILAGGMAYFFISRKNA